MLEIKHAKWLKKRWLYSNREKYDLDQLSKMRWNESNNQFLKKMPVDSDQRKCDSNQMPYDSKQAQNLIRIK